MKRHAFITKNGPLEKPKYGPSVHLLEMGDKFIFHGHEFYIQNVDMSQEMNNFGLTAKLKIECIGRSLSNGVSNGYRF